MHTGINQKGNLKEILKQTKLETQSTSIYGIQEEDCNSKSYVYSNKYIYFQRILVRGSR